MAIEIWELKKMLDKKKIIKTWVHAVFMNKEEGGSKACHWKDTDFTVMPVGYMLHFAVKDKLIKVNFPPVPAAVSLI